MGVEQGRRVAGIATGCLVAIGIAAVVSSLFLPVLRDEGGYLFIAYRVAHGAVYARDYL